MSLAITAFAGVSMAGDGAVPQTIDFNRDVRPILSDNCYFCHGPDKNKRKADLRLDTREGIFSTIKDHHTVVPGQPGASELYRLVTSADPEVRMPDPKSNKKLSDRDIAVVKKWIEQGAPWQGHWAYLKPQRPALPEVDKSAIIRNPIDRFVLARLKEAGLTPAPEADKRTLIRRLSFDLTGLPPTPREVDAFLSDTSADAYEKLVDRLLASPHFGERMAVFWLDLVRYADSIGYHSDNPMNVSPYRDYVIGAFNANKPFDQFTIEQLAGDLLQNPTTEQKIATAYNRLLQTTEEGGAQPREYEVKYLTDRVRSVSTVWMGATMGCCQCHDHKFDPFTMKDFYSMGAFFADVQEASTGRREVGMNIPTAAQESELKKLDETLAATEEKLLATTPELLAEQAQWEKSQVQSVVEWKTLELETKTANGTKLEKQSDGSYQASGAFPAKETYTLKADANLRDITGIRIEALADDKFPARGPGVSPNGNFVLTAVKVELTQPNEKNKPVALARASADFSQDNFPAASVIGKNGPGWAVLPKFGENHAIILEPKSPVNADGNVSLKFVLEFQSIYSQHQIGRLRLSVTTSPVPAGMQSIPPKVREALAVATGDRNDEQRAEIANYFRTIAPSLQGVRDEIAKIGKDKEALNGAIAKCLVTTAASPREVKLLHRGNWMDTTGEVVTPAIPAFLASSSVPDKDASHRLTRLDLARWLVSPENPLTARAYVNRLWRLYFGTGIAKVLDDLGSQGEWPTHPELLDWMASEFSKPTGNAAPWDTKRMIRLLVTTSTYRQSSQASETSSQRDPYNRLLSHQSRWRLDAEFVRDDALSISGLLVDKLGGPSVKPYQPAGYWDQLNFPTRTYIADTGENQYRRGLYTWWQRSFLHPSLAAFDAPSHEEAVCERNRSNIPQQALVLLNDPTYVEASRAFAVRIMREGGASTRERIQFALEIALSRKPRADEIAILADLYERHLKDYSADNSAAERLLSVGEISVPKDLNKTELAAWMSVARVILNLHETITRM